VISIVETCICLNFNGSVPWFQRFIFPLPFAMKLIKINLWNQGNGSEFHAGTLLTANDLP
jgi:hypothetical protein